MFKHQPGWSKYEAAILLDGYLEVLAGKTPRKDVVSRVSKDLRQIAVNQGIAIDDIFRNESGIHFQMRSMESAYQGYTVSKPASRLFLDVATIYKNNRSEFEELLTEAKAMATGVKESSVEVKSLIQLIIYRPVKGIVTEIKEALHIVDEDSNIDTYAVDLSALNDWIEHEDVEFINQTLIACGFFDRDNEELQALRKLADVAEAGTNHNNAYSVYMDAAKKVATGYDPFSESAQRAIASYLYSADKAGTINKESVAHTAEQIIRAKVADWYKTLFLYINARIPHDAGLPRDADGDLIIVHNDLVKNFRSALAKRKVRGGIWYKKERVALDKLDLTSFREVLKRFPRGFRISSILDMKRFRSFWKEKYGEELSESDDNVRKYVEHITIPYNNLVYLPEMMLSESASDALQSYLAKCFDEGKTAVYFDALYKEFESEFENSHINNPGMLKTYLAHVYKGKYFIHRSYITAVAGVEVDPAIEVREYMIAAGLPVTKDDLKSEFSHIDEKELIRVIQGANSDEFVRNQQGEYFHADIIKFSQQEMDTIRGLIQSAIADKDYMAGKELIDSIASRLPEINERYPFLTPFGLRDAIAYKLRDEFSFKGKIISTYGQDLSMTDVFAHFASVHEHFTLDQLNSLKLDLNTPIYFDPVYENSLRVSMDDFVSRNQARFDVDATDDAISRFCTGDYIALKNISFFGSFPDAGFPWNVFLLEHYVASFSKKYKLLHLNFIASTPAGAIVSRSSNFDNFDDVLANELAKSNIPMDAESSLQYLVDTGFLARKRYTGIEQVLMRAKQQRASLSD